MTSGNMQVHDEIGAGGTAGPGRDPRRAPRGRAGGQAAGQAGHAGLLGAAGRGHDALATILAQNQIRVPELLSLRHQRMAASPWNYYRGRPR